MAVVGSAYVVVHAITAGFEKEVENAVSKLKPQMSSMGNDLGKSLGSGASSGLKTLSKNAEQARLAFNKLTVSGYYLGPAISGAVSAVSDLIIGLGAMIGYVGIAAPALTVLGNSFSALAQAGITAKLAFSGIGKAVQALNKQQIAGVKDTGALEAARQRLAQAYEQAAMRSAKANDKVREAQQRLNQAYKEGAEYLQQLGFDAEDAAISQQKAAVELERARETLMRSQDLPPDSRAAREAELAFKQADLNYRKTVDKVNDLAEAQKYAAKTGIEGTQPVLDAKKNLAEASNDLVETERQNSIDIANAQRSVRDAMNQSNAAANAVADAMKGLSPEAQKFAKYIAGLKPVLDSLKGAAGKNLFGPLQNAIQNLVDNLVPVLVPILEKTGGVLGKFAEKFADMLVRNKGVIERIFGESNIKILENFGDAFINIADAALKLLDAARPLAEKFSEWLKNTTSGLKDADMEGIMKNAGDAATVLAGAVSGVFDGFKAFAKAAAPLGKVLFESLGNAGRGMADFFSPKTKKDQDAMDSKFTQIGENIKAMGGFFSEVLKAMFDLAGNKGVQDFFEAVKPIPGIFAGMGKTLTTTGPVFGEFLTQLAKVIALFVDTGGIEMFFGILTKALAVVEKIFSNDTVKQIFLFLAMFKGATLAIGKIFGVLKFAGYILISPFLMLGNAIIKVGGFIENFGKKVGVLKTWLGQVGKGLQAIWGVITRVFGTLFRVMGTIFRFIFSGFTKVVQLVVAGFRLIGIAAAANPLGAIILAIMALIAIFVIAYNKSETFRNIVNGAFEKIKQVVMGVIDWFKDAIPKAFEFIKNAFLKFTPLGIFISNWDKIVGFVKGLPAKIASAAKGLWDGLTSSFKTAINWIITKWNDFKLEIKIPSNFVTDKLGWSGKGITLDTPNIPLLAEGGTVYPRSGGVNAILAEAGRPERVEPLDQNGMSARDKAMIDYMSGGRGGATPTFNIYPSQGMDELALAHNVSRNVAWTMRRGV